MMMGFTILSFKSVQLKAVSFQLIAKIAEVVKLANTLRSGRSGRKLLRVQLPSSACLNHMLAKMIWVSAKGGPAVDLPKAGKGGQVPPSAHVETCYSKSFKW